MLDAHTRPAASPLEKRAGLAIVSNCVTPYRINLHNLIAAGIPELKLHTLVTHGDADFRWNVDLPAEIHVQYFGRPDESPTASVWHAPRMEWSKGRRLIRFLQDNGVRAVICNGYRHISYLRTIQFCHRQGIPLFVRNDSNIRGDSRRSLPVRAAKSCVYRWWLKRVAGVMSMGDWGDQLFMKYGADPRRLYRVPYTPDYEAYQSCDITRLQEFRRRFRLREQRRYLMYSGRLVPVKRVDLLIDAFAELAPMRPEWDLLIVGDGPLADDLRRRVPEQLRQRVVWTGFLDQTAGIPAYHAADALVLPSDYEPWAVVVQEAMAAGMVVIVSDVVGAGNELIEDNKSGRVFIAGAVDSLLQAMMDVTNPGHLKQFKERSQTALQDWRAKIQPVMEIRRALVDVGVLAGQRVCGV